LEESRDPTSISGGAEYSMVEQLISQLKTKETKRQKWKLYHHNLILSPLRMRTSIIDYVQKYQIAVGYEINVAMGLYFIIIDTHTLSSIRLITCSV
jgi:hypothetical protein